MNEVKEGALGILAGSGSLPAAIARAAVERGDRVFVIAFDGFADIEALREFPHATVRLGKAGKILSLLKENGCTQVVMIGALVRPAIRTLGFDLKTLSMLPMILRMFRGGDNHLLSMIARYFEERGFKVVGAHEIAPQILMPSGALGHYTPDETAGMDIRLGLDVIAALDRFDIGQAVVVCEGRVLAIEAAEGTDLMLERLLELQENGRLPRLRRSGVLVKSPKPSQDRRVDLPAIGARTVETAAQAGLAGVAVVAGSTLVAEPAEVARSADQTKLFVAGIAI